MNVRWPRCKVIADPSIGPRPSEKLALRFHLMARLIDRLLSSTRGKQPVRYLTVRETIATLQQLKDALSERWQSGTSLVSGLTAWA